MTDFDIANRALQNPAIFTNKHYKQAVYAVAAGLAIRLVIAIPVGSHSLFTPEVLLPRLTRGSLLMRYRR